MHTQFNYERSGLKCQNILIKKLSKTILIMQLLAVGYLATLLLNLDFPATVFLCKVLLVLLHLGLLNLDGLNLRALE